jgi:hypothetical protein
VHHQAAGIAGAELLRVALHCMEEHTLRTGADGAGYGIAAQAMVDSSACRRVYEIDAY